MKVLIDTNVILDVLIGREPYVEASAAFLRLCGVQITGLITVSQTTDISYLLRRDGKSAAEAKTVIQTLITNVKATDVTVGDMVTALGSDISDYEDALIACSGNRNKAEYIVTRNEKDFISSPIPALSPQAFLQRFFS